jgi:hypothetical protein
LRTTSPALMVVFLSCIFTSSSSNTDTIRLHVLRIWPPPRTSSYGMVCSTSPVRPYMQGPPPGWQDIYNRDTRRLDNSICQLPTAGINHPPLHRICSTTSNSIQHHDSYHKVSTLFVLSEGTAVSTQGEVVVVVRWMPLTGHTHRWHRLECHLASPKLLLPGWNAVFATWWLFILDLELLNSCWCKKFKNAATVKLSSLT